MAVAINKKLLSDKDKQTISSVCPMGVFEYDPNTKEIVADNDKCICCGACASCVGDDKITVVSTPEEAAEIQEDMDK